MKQIQFIRSAPYAYNLPSHDLYTSYNMVCSGLLNPDVDISKISKQLHSMARNSVVFASNVPRARTTARALNPRYTTINDLHEIDYSMEQLMSAKEFASYDPVYATTKARQLFFPKLFEDQLFEKRKELRKRVIRVLELLSDETAPIMVVSHGFFIKFVEVVVREPRAMRNKKAFIHSYNGSKPAFGFLTGPSFSHNEIQSAINNLLIK